VSESSTAGSGVVSGTSAAKNITQKENINGTIIIKYQQQTHLRALSPG